MKHIFVDEVTNQCALTENKEKDNHSQRETALLGFPMTPGPFPLKVEEVERHQRENTVTKTEIRSRR